MVAFIMSMFFICSGSAVDILSYCSQITKSCHGFVKTSFTLVPPNTLNCSPVAACLFLSASVAACELASLTLSLCVAAARWTGKPVSLSASVWVALLFLFSGARVSLRLSVGVGLNPGDIRWRDARSCHYPCGEAHHHPTAERRSARQPRKRERERERERESCDSLTSARKLWWSCKKRKKTHQKKARDLHSLSLQSSVENQRKWHHHNCRYWSPSSSSY